VDKTHGTTPKPQTTSLYNTCIKPTSRHIGRTDGHTETYPQALPFSFPPSLFPQSLAPALRGRVRLVHHWNYVNALHHATAVLDTWPYGGCLSTLDAWAHAVPVVTLPSHLLRGRSVTRK
jgi:hypothetical protein